MINESRVTIELRNIPYEQLWDFDYNFYDDDHRQEFQKLFYDFFAYSEIGFETLGRFKHRLKLRLNLKNREWKQLYETELACKDIQFMLNKDLKETFIRENTSTNETSGTSEDRSSDLNNGVSDVNLVTNVTSTSGNKNESNYTGKDTEKTELISQGNIGITSSAQLLKEWRSILINLDEMILNNCKDLFITYFIA